MGLMDKFKNLFTDEEFEEEEEEFEEPVKIKEVKKEKTKDKLPTFMREKIEKEEAEEKLENDDENVSDFKINKNYIENLKNEEQFEKQGNEELNIKKEEEPKKEKFKFPIDFDDNDFKDVSRVSRQARSEKNNLDTTETHNITKNKKSHKIEPKKEVKVAELYKDKRDNDKRKNDKRFQATPIISPIYGVLNKNYRKEEIEPISGDNYEINRPSKNLDFDSVRKKAYGNTLVDDIKNNMMCENCDYFKKAKSCKKNEDRDNLMYEALCEQNKEDDITLDEATENYYDYGVEYEKSHDYDNYEIEDDYIEAPDEVKIINHDDEKQKTIPKKNQKSKTKKHEVPPVKSSINLLSTLKKSMGDEEEEDTKSEKNLELTDDLFNLIDSMYDEGKE